MRKKEMEELFEGKRDRRRQRLTHYVAKWTSQQHMTLWSEGYFKTRHIGRETGS